MLCYLLEPNVDIDVHLSFVVWSLCCWLQRFVTLLFECFGLCWRCVGCFGCRVLLLDYFRFDCFICFVYGGYLYLLLGAYWCLRWVGFACLCYLVCSFFCVVTFSLFVVGVYAFVIVDFMLLF